MDKRAEISAAMKKALKEKDQIALSTTRLILAALKDRDIASLEKSGAEGISEEEILLLLQSMIKQRQESSKAYSEAGRDDLAEREEAEVEVIRTFMPQQLSDDEVGKIIDEIISTLESPQIKDMGKIMAVLKEKYAGQVDMGKAGGIAKAKLQ